MKKTHIISSLAVSLFFITIKNIDFDRLKIDGLIGEISIFILETEDTKYSKKYSHKAFNKIEIGMSKEEVNSIIGKPLDNWNPTKKTKEISFVYSISPSSTHYRLRQIQFSENLVSAKIGYFYVD